MGKVRHRRHWSSWRDERGAVSGVEILFSMVFLIALFLFLVQVVIWWHTKNILEQAAAEGARAAAAADTSCGSADPAARNMAGRMGGEWVSSLTVSCGGDGTQGSTVRVTVSASTPMFGLPGSMNVSAAATAPSEGRLGP